MPSPFYPRRPGCALRVLPAALAALSLGLPQAVLAADVTINTNVTGSVYGNSASNDPTLRSGDPTGKSLEVVSSGIVTEIAYGGYNNGSGSVTNNSATVSGGSVGWHVVGGYSGSGSATNNHATVSGGSVAGNVAGGYSTS
ncbi:MAG: hypothetical protein VB101_02315, partial [Rhodospirillaceae bacterium]|nr:hypothetical protein [Rhodospirillaceae bacterium]